jgi:hypothetical protein
MRKKQPPALERLKAKLEALGYEFKPEYVRRLTSPYRNAEWWQSVSRDAPLTDRMKQLFCSNYTVAQLAKDGVEIEIDRTSGYLWIEIKKAKTST